MENNLINFNGRYVQLIHGCFFAVCHVRKLGVVVELQLNEDLGGFLNFILPVSKPAFFLQASLKNFEYPVMILGERLGGRQGWCIFLLKERFRTPDSSKSQASWGGAELKSQKKLCEVVNLLLVFERREADIVYIQGGAPSPVINGVKYLIVV